MTSFDVVWQRIVTLAGEEFRQKTGRPFRYTILANSLMPSTTNRLLPRSHFARAFDRAPLRGPGQLQDLQGPSYLYAILTDARVVNGPGRAVPAQEPLKSALTAVPAQDMRREDSNTSNSPPSREAAWPGHPILATELAQLGFQPLELRVTNLNLLLSSGWGCEWTTIGEVPDAPGVYAFTVEDHRQLRVAYVGLAEHLWMVTKGRLPDGGARGGQRYGRPRHAGATRQRVNILIAEQLRAGRLVRHWVSQLSLAALRAEEERLITS